MHVSLVFAANNAFRPFKIALDAAQHQLISGHPVLEVIGDVIGGQLKVSLPLAKSAPLFPLPIEPCEREAEHRNQRRKHARQPPQARGAAHSAQAAGVAGVSVAHTRRHRQAATAGRTDFVKRRGCHWFCGCARTGVPGLAHCRKKPLWASVLHCQCPFSSTLTDAPRRAGPPHHTFSGAT